MALDIHNAENNEFLFAIKEEQLSHLLDIFDGFKQRTGIYIDPYRDTILSIGNQTLLLKLIEEYVKNTNLNQDKEQTSNILAFSGLLAFFISKSLTIKFLGD